MAAAGNDARPGLRLGVVVGLPGVPLPTSIELACEAERAGLDFIGAGEGPTENFAMLGALTQATERAELITTIAHWSRTPVTFAQGASTLAALSEGRYRLGLGASPRAWSTNWHDVPYERPTDRLEDLVAAIRAAWNTRQGAPGAHQGDFYRFSEYEHNLSDWAPVPIYLGVTRPRSIELAGRVADGAVFNLMHSLEWLRSEGLPTLKQGCVASQRSVAELDTGVLVVGAVDHDRDRAFELARPGIGFYFSVPYFAPLLRLHGFEEELERGAAAWARQDFAAMAAAVSDRMVEAFALAGTAEDIRRKLSDYGQLVDFVEVMAPLGLPPEETLEQARRLTETLSEARRA